MIAVAIVAMAQAAVFAPPLGVPIRIVTERTEGDWHFRMERLVRFAREGRGYRAEVWMAGADAQGSERVSALMEAGFAGLAGRMMAFHLDGAGKVTAIDDIDALWAHFCDGIAAAVRIKSADAEPLIGPLRVLSAAQRLGILASLVTALIAEEASEPAGTRPVRIPAKSPYGGQLILTGTRSVDRLGITQHSSTRAEADIAGKDGPAHVTLKLTRDSDPATGLIATTTETVITRIGARTHQRVSTARVTVEPVTPWPANWSGIQIPVKKPAHLLDFR